MRQRSLRSRVLLGALLWTLGLLAVSHIILVSTYRVTAFVKVAHGTMLSVVAVACLALGLSQVRAGLSTLGRLRASLSAVRDGSGRRVAGSFPAEVQPLVDELNALLDHREKMISRALSKAGDLAHGLKTPLAVLTQEAEIAAAAGHPDLAAAIDQQVERMRRQVDYHLAQARAAGSGANSGARSEIAASAEGLSRTLLRLHADRQLAIDVRIPSTHTVGVQREDLDEILGNLLDNACKWARSRVSIASTPAGNCADITIDDDGPGIAAGLRDEVLRRGVRADEASPGSGLGLAIVRDLTELYGGTITLETSPDGGLRARLALPSA
jgi:signal transduction histidine kinase